MRSLLPAGLALVLGLLGFVAIGLQYGTPLGPADGGELPPFDTGRVAVGDTAPDFTLASMDGGRVTLSDYRGERTVVLVFYRGHW